jgi:hypothetical protein
VTFHFCPDCGGTVFWEPEQRPELIAVAVGMFGDPDFGQPQSPSNKWNIRTEGRPLVAMLASPINPANLLTIRRPRHDDQ